MEIFKMLQVRGKTFRSDSDSDSDEEGKEIGTMVFEVSSIPLQYMWVFDSFNRWPADRTSKHTKFAEDTILQWRMKTKPVEGLAWLSYQESKKVPTMFPWVTTKMNHIILGSNAVEGFGC